MFIAEAMNIDRYDHWSHWFMHEYDVHAMKDYWSCMKTVDHSYEQALIMPDNVHIHVIMNIIVIPTSSPQKPQNPPWSVVSPRAPNWYFHGRAEGESRALPINCSVSSQTDFLSRRSSAIVFTFSHFLKSFQNKNLGNFLGQTTKTEEDRSKTFTCSLPSAHLSHHLPGQCQQCKDI